MPAAKDAQGFSIQVRCFLGHVGDVCISELGFPSHRIYLPIHRFRLEVVHPAKENKGARNLKGKVCPPQTLR